MALLALLGVTNGCTLLDSTDGRLWLLWLLWLLRRRAEALGVVNASKSMVLAASAMALG